MENFRWIAVGINRYRFLPPLNYAQADAQALHQFLGEELKLPPHLSLLLTDTSPAINRQSTYPNRDNLLFWLEAKRREKQESILPIPHPPSSILWFFFSGYGINYQGEDYLMPIDGNPQDIPNTGISLRSLFTSLQQQGASQIIAILDINRSTTGATVGEQALSLGKKMGMAVILSCQPDQFSQETAALGHGIFTAALLEALRYYRQNITLAKLNQYLRDRLGEFSASYWRPMQTPVIISPSLEASYQPLLPAPGRVQIKWESPQRQRVKQATAPSSIPFESGKTATLLLPKLPEMPPTLLTPPPAPPAPQGASSFAPLHPHTPPTSPTPHSSLAWLLQFKWLLLGSAIALLLAMLLFKWLVLTPVNLVGGDRETERAILNRARSYLRWHQASQFNQAIGEAGKIKPYTSLYREAQGDIKRWSQVILDIAQGRANQGDFRGAIAAAQLIPPQQEKLSALAQQSIEQWQFLMKREQTTRVLIEAAQSLIQPAQASSYNRAITTLQQIAPGEPGYAQAQQLIAQWSEQIYRLAQLRAAAGNFQQARQTAELVPLNTPFYEKAQRAIGQWRQRK
jgi:uncharacterized caspase-like protein